MKSLLKKPRKNRTIDADKLSSHHSKHDQPRYALRKGLGCWGLTFDGKSAVLMHEQGIYYVAYLLMNPAEEPIHGLALALKIKALYAHAANSNQRLLTSSPAFL
jgi:hypothetical protein